MANITRVRFHHQGGADPVVQEFDEVQHGAAKQLRVKGRTDVNARVRVSARVFYRINGMPFFRVIEPNSAIQGNAKAFNVQLPDFTPAFKTRYSLIALAWDTN